jgi:Zn-dependent protease
MRFSKIELKHLAICWIALGLCFSIGAFFNKAGDPFTTTLMNFFAILMVVLIGMGTGFILHEVAHKAVSQMYGCWAEFRIWKPGLIFAVATAVLSFGTFLFFAPGAVHTLATRDLTPKEQGYISSAGPVTNLAVAVLFLLFYFLRHSFGTAGDFMFNFEVLGLTFKSYPFNIFTLLGRTGFQLNLWLAAFNLIPFGPLDGVAILRWSKPAWGVLALISWGVFLLTTIGVINL